VLSLTAARAGTAQETNRLTFGLRASVASCDEKENFNQYEAFINRELPWNWQLEGGWNVIPKIELTAGVLKGGGDSAFVGSLGPTFTLSGMEDRLSLDVGVSPTVLGRRRFGEQSFGEYFQFTSHASINLEIIRNLHVGYRYQHMSNASINEINPGLDLHMFELSYRF
jgi:hypothetical protein